MNLSQAKLIFLEENYYEGDEHQSEIKVLPLNSFEHAQVGEIINTLLGNYSNQHHPDFKRITQILNLHGFYTPNQIKEKKGIKFSNNDKFYFTGLSYGQHLIELNDYQFRGFSPEQLETILKNDTVFVEASIPTEAKEKIRALIKEKEDKINKNAAKKAQRKIEKAKKILAESGIKV